MFKLNCIYNDKNPISVGMPNQMEAQKFWTEINKYVTSDCKKWNLKKQKLPADYLLSSYFSLSAALHAGNTAKIQTTFTEFESCCARADPDELAPYIDLLFAELNIEQQEALYPRLDLILLSCWKQGSYRAISRILKCIPEGKWLDFKSFLEAAQNSPEHLDANLLAGLARQGSQHRFNGTESFWQALVNRAEKTPAARRLALELAVIHSETCHLSNEQVIRLFEKSQGDAASLFYLWQILQSAGYVDLADQAAWLALLQGNFASADLLCLCEYFLNNKNAHGATTCARYLHTQSELSHAQSIQLGLDLFELGIPDEAEYFLQQGVKRLRKKDSPWQQAQICLLAIALKLRTYPEIMQQYRLVRQFLENALPFHLDVLECMVEHGEKKEAADDFLRFDVVNNIANQDGALSFFAFVLADQGEVEKAFEQLEIGFNALGTLPGIVETFLSLTITYNRYRRSAERILSFTDISTTSAAMAVICLERAERYEPALHVFTPEIDHIPDMDLRQTAIQSYITSLFHEGYWDDVLNYLEKLPPGLIESQWGIFHQNLARIQQYKQSDSPDTTALTLAFERLLASPLSVQELDELAKALIGLFRKFPALQSEWQFMDLESYILLHVAKLVENNVVIAAKDKRISVLEREDLLDRLGDLSIESVGQILTRFKELGLDQNVTKR